jgi:hypothetical protein
MWASCEGELDIVRQLLEAGADADIVDKVQHALLFLHYCVICYFEVTCIIWLPGEQDRSAPGQNISHQDAHQFIR